MTYIESIGNISEIYRIQKEKLEGLNKFFLENLGDKVTILEDGGEISFRDLLDIIRQSYDEYILLLNRVESIINSPMEGRISKTDIEVIKEQLLEITNFPESLRNEYLGTLDLWKEQFPKINYDEVYQKINEYKGLLTMASECSIEIQKLLKMRISEKDGYYIFQDEGNTEKGEIEEGLGLLDDKIDENEIQINKFLIYDMENYIFRSPGLEGAVKLRRGSKPKRESFMRALIAGKGKIVGHDVLCREMNINISYTSPYDVLSIHKEEIKNTYHSIRKSIDTKFKWKNVTERKKSEFCETSGGYKLRTL